MSPVSKTSLQQWRAQQSEDLAFLTEKLELEAGYQIARLCLLRGMVQAELADRLGILEGLIVCFENGSSMPSLPFLERIAEALDAQVKIRITPKASMLNNSD